MCDVCGDAQHEPQVSRREFLRTGALAALKKRYGVRQVPATLFYDNDHGKMELERTDYSVPAMIEYRTPRPLFWNTYYQTIRRYIRENILD